jgi:predicted GNAT family acetyltransferase
MGATKQITKPKKTQYEIIHEDFMTKIVANFGNSRVGELYARDIDSEQTLFVTSAYVTENFREQGIATELNRLLVLDAKRQGYIAMFCSARNDNHTIHRILLNTGWHLITMGRNISYYYQNLEGR